MGDGVFRAHFRSNDHERKNNERKNNEPIFLSQFFLAGKASGENEKKFKIKKKFLTVKTFFGPGIDFQQSVYQSIDVG